MHAWMQVPSQHRMHGRRCQVSIVMHACSCQVSIVMRTCMHAGAKSAHILVYDRHEQRVIEETISPYMVLAMRNMYQTPVGRLMIGSGAHKALLDLTQREGRYMNSPASIKVGLQCI